MNIYEFTFTNRDGQVVSLADYKGKVILIVNTATGCGFTPQYESLEKLYETYHDNGFEILDFPCDQFGHQAPGSDSEIHDFCVSKYNTTFDQQAKICVNGENESKLYTYLKVCIEKDEIHGFKNMFTMNGIKKISSTYKNKNDIVWNFTKFLVDREGNVVRRLSPIMDPMILEDEIINL